MGLIKDIRLFEADWPNEDYFSIPHYIGRIFRFDGLGVLDMTERLVFLLRSRGFCLDGFDHLYLNYTTMLPDGELRRAKRTSCREDSWLRWVDIGCDAEAFNSWEPEKKTAFVLSTLTEAVVLMSPPEQREMAKECVRLVLEEKERLVIPYKRKENQEYMVDVLVRITDEPDYIPVLRVTQKGGAIVYETELRPYDRNAFICQFSSFSIGKRSLRISPRKNFESEFYELEPIKVSW